MNLATNGLMDGPKPPAGDSSSRTRMILLWIALVGAAVLTCAARAELVPQEAYYWTYAQHPALSYYDHPPMVAWLITLGTTLLGDTEFGIRIMHLLLYFGSIWLMFRTATVWFGQQAGLWAALLFATTPLYVATGFVTTPDGPLIFFWMLTLYSLSRALLEKSTRYWMFAGVALGLGMLSKYTAFILAPCLLLFMFFSPEHRFWLRRPQPWIAALLSVLVLSPVLIWNAQNEWVSLLFQSTRTLDQPEHKLLSRIFTVVVMQPVLMAPPAFALLVIGGVRAVRYGWLKHSDGWNFAASFSMPLLLVALYSMSKSDDIRYQWIAPAYLSLIPAAAAVLTAGFASADPNKARRWGRYGLTTVAFSLIMVLLLLSFMAFGHPRVGAITARLGCWRELAGKVEEAEARLQSKSGIPPFVISFDKYKTSAVLGFYTGDPDSQINRLALGGPGLGYSYWRTDLASWKGRPAIAVIRNLQTSDVDLLKKYFDHVEKPRPVQVQTINLREQTFHLVSCHGYHPEGVKISPNNKAGTR